MMALTYKNNGDGTATVTLTYTAPKTKIDAILEDAAHQLWNTGLGDHGADGIRLWASLSNQEKFSLLDDTIKRNLTQWAKDYHVYSSIETAKTTALGEGVNYDL
jgi:hypothetical protein